MGLGRANSKRTSLRSTISAIASIRPPEVPAARHNPYFIIKKKETSYQAGGCYGFNLVYSGNHYEEVEYSSFDKLRVQTGISPLGFKKTLQKGESFVTPLAVLTFSDQGLNGLIHVMHDFVNAHVIPKSSPTRPVPLSSITGKGLS
jgi:alpha-galactosidase